MKQYLDLLREILVNGGIQYNPRTEEHTLGLGGAHKVYDLTNGFPLLTTKKVNSKSAFYELFWKLRGERNVKSLFDQEVHIWDRNAFQRHLQRRGATEQYPKHTPEWDAEFERYKKALREEPDFIGEGDLGPVYGYQWRHWTGRDGKETDQLVKLLTGLKKEPGSRYHLMSAWNVGEISEMAIGPCPMIHQFNVFGQSLDLHMYQRSCDVFLGVPFNMAQDSLLLSLVAKEVGLRPRNFFHSFGNVHVYLGVSPRADFWRDSSNVAEFQQRVRAANSVEGYLRVKDWYESEAPAESKGNERKDHMPFVLEQLSKSPRASPSIEIRDLSLFEAIAKPVSEVVEINGYNPHEWDCRAVMAA